jgi:hypothetical protein
MSNINKHFKTLREKTKFKLKKKGGMVGLTLVLLLLVSAIAYYLITKSDDTGIADTGIADTGIADTESPICIDCTGTPDPMIQTEDCHVDCPCVPSRGTPSDFDECACDGPDVVKIRRFGVDDVGTYGGTDCVNVLRGEEGFFDMGGSYRYNTYTGQIVHTVECSSECPTDCEVGAWSTWGPECPCVDATTWWQQKQTRDIDVVTHPRNRSDQESLQNCLQVVRAQADVPGSVTVLDVDTFQETRSCECTYVPCQPSDYTATTRYKRGKLFSPSIGGEVSLRWDDVRTILSKVNPDYTLNLTQEQLKTLSEKILDILDTETTTIANFSNLDTLLENNEIIMSLTSYARKPTSVCQGGYTTEYAARISPAAPIIQFNPRLDDSPNAESANVQMLTDPYGNRNNYLGYHHVDHPAEYTLVVDNVPTSHSYWQNIFSIPNIATGTKIKVRKTITFMGKPFHFYSNTVTVTDATESESESASDSGPV